jgi:hypothetical protein
MKFIKPEEEYTRYQHSIGVLYLLRIFGASLEEQVMGLLHDVSHTVFSHVADYLFNTIQDKYSYQDSIFCWYIEQTDLAPILAKYDLSWLCTPQILDSFSMLKNNIPNLCADRLEYNLYGGYLEGLLTKDDIMNIINSLSYTDNAWVFNDITTARLFAHVALKLCTDIWCADWNCFIYSETAKLLQRACQLDYITIDELIFSDDATVWNKLCNIYDDTIQRQISRILRYKTEFVRGNTEIHDYIIQGKFRWIDPLIRTKAGTIRLSTLDTHFEEYIKTVQKEFREPYYITYTTMS